MARVKVRIAILEDGLVGIFGPNVSVKNYGEIIGKLFRP